MSIAAIAQYRRQAQHARTMAEQSRDPEISRRWLELAAEFDKLARSVERAYRAHGGETTQ